LYCWLEEQGWPFADRVASRIKKRIARESDPTLSRELKFALALTYKARDDHSAAEVVYLKLIEEDPSDPSALILLAEQKLHEQLPEEALRIIERAIAVASHLGHLRRHSLAVKARIASELKAYDVVESVLKQIMNLNLVPGTYDVGIERDFFDRLPAGAISAEVARQYDEFTRQRR
jgi:hypothetical protein